jgi:hypothetical protein
MLRAGLFASVLPLVLVGLLSHGESAKPPQPCITLGDISAQIAALPWQAQVKVGFTDDPALASVRVQIVDRAEIADFAMVDDLDEAETSACSASARTRHVAIATTPSISDPLIYLSRDDGADYRIFVNSKTFSPRDAAALIVAASGGHGHLATAALAGQL